MAVQFHDNPLLVAGLFAAIAGIFVLALKVLSVGSGWSDLARRYPGQPATGGMAFEAASISSSRSGSYGRQMIITVDRHALHLSAHLPCRLFHPPISVPWKRIRGFVSHPWQSGLQGISFSEMELVFYMDENVILAARAQWNDRAGETTP